MALVKRDRTQFIYIGKGVLIGLLTGCAVSLFRLLIEQLLRIWSLLYHAVPAHPFVLFIILALCLGIPLLIGLLIQEHPDVMGSGIPQVEGQLTGELEISGWQVFWRKFLTGVLGIGSGLFLGREGPSIQLGAASAQIFAEKLKEDRSMRRILIAGGAAAGLSAAFDAPIAGTLFVLEEIYHSFSPLVWMVALSSAISADFVSSSLFGLQPVLHITVASSYPLTDYWQLLLLGILLGLGGILYQRVLLNMPRLYAKLPKLPRAYHGLIPFLLVIPIGLLWTNTLGGGNGLILSLGHSVPALSILLGLLLLRFVFSMISYGSGLPGGIFLPILSLGALLGAIYGRVLVELNMLPSGLLANLIVFAMAGYFAGISKAPFTAIILITEMVGSLAHLLPLAVVSLTAYLIVDLLGGAPIYQSLLERMTKKGTATLTTNDVDRVEVPVFAGSQLTLRQVRDIKWPENSLLVSIRRGEKMIIPHGDTLIHSGDHLILMVEAIQRPRVFTLLKQMNTPSMTD
ncbi:MAG: chloride channel protein [Sporolactobacillus sp.]